MKSRANRCLLHDPRCEQRGQISARIAIPKSCGRMCDPSVSVGVPAWTRARGNWQPEWLTSRFSDCLSRLPDAEFEKLFTNLPSRASWQLFKTGDSFPTVKLNSQFG